MNKQLRSAVAAVLGIATVTGPAFATGIQPQNVPIDVATGLVNAKGQARYSWDAGNIGYGPGGTNKGGAGPETTRFPPYAPHQARVGGLDPMDESIVDETKFLGWNHSMLWIAFEIKTAGGYTVAVDRLSADTYWQPAFSLFYSGQARWDALGSSHSFNQVRGPADSPMNRNGNAGGAGYMITGNDDIVEFVGYANSGSPFTNGEDSVIKGALAAGTSEIGPLQNPSLPYNDDPSKGPLNFYTSIVTKGAYTDPHAGEIGPAYAGMGSSVNTNDPTLPNDSGGGHIDLKLWLKPGWYVIGPGGSCGDFTCTPTAIGLGAYRVTVMSNPDVMPPMMMGHARRDLSGDGKGDLVWRKQGAGSNKLWLMNGGSRMEAAKLDPQGENWAIAGVADFNDDHMADILWRNATSGDNEIWLMNGGQRTQTIDLQVQTGDFVVAHAGDFDGDGDADILWTNPVNGETHLWVMNGPALESEVGLPASANGSSFAEAGDLNGDGKLDIVWRDGTSGQNAAWLMNGSATPDPVSIPKQAAAWVSAGAGDFDGDGKCDLLWRNETSGQTQLWLMNGGSRMSVVKLPKIGKAWSVAGVDDYDGDGKLDILWRDDSNGKNKMWLMDGTMRKADSSVNRIAKNWVTPEN